MRPIIVQGGQTGVDRGAHEGALDNGWDVMGYMPKHGMDECGPIPTDVAKYLRYCERPGYPARTEANLIKSRCLITVVQNADDPYRTRGTKLTLFRARELNIPRQIVQPGPDENLNLVVNWLQILRSTLSPDVPFTVMIAGPRESLWPSARVETAGMLRRLRLAIDNHQHWMDARKPRRQP